MKKSKIIKSLGIGALCLTSAFALAGCDPQKKNDVQPNAEIYEVFALAQANGETRTYEEWLASIKGDTGVGISSVIKTNTQGKVDTYTITFTNGTTTTFTITNGTDACTTYTVTYDYGEAKTFFDNNKDSATVQSNEWLTGLPTIKDGYKDSFLGWFITGTDRQIKDYDFIGDDVTLYAKFDVTNASTSSGLYQEGKYVKTWAQLKQEYSIAISTNAIASRGFYYSDLISLEGYLVIDNGITSLNELAFANCAGLKGVTIPRSVTNIGYNSFLKCAALTNITVASDNTIYDSRNNCNAIIEKSTNKLIVGCKNTIIPNGVTSISSCAFYGCKGLTSISIPASVSSIETHAFSDCYGLTSITVDNENITYDSRDNCNAIIEKSTNKLIVGCKNTIIPNGVTSISSYAFYGCMYLTSISIPTSVTSIGDYAFSDCLKLTSITIPDSVISVGVGAFQFCDELSSITIGKGVSQIGEMIFYGCGNLLNIAVDAENITYDSRNDCNAIIKKSTNELIFGCRQTIIPDSVTSIGEKAFYYFNIFTVVIPDSVTSIGKDAFYGTHITITYYKGTEAQWSSITIGSNNEKLTNNVKYYSATQPAENVGNYWHYDTDGVTPIVWTEE